jgi:hypothetical protein
MSNYKQHAQEWQCNGSARDAKSAVYYVIVLISVLLVLFCRIAPCVQLPPIRDGEEEP